MKNHFFVVLFLLSLCQSLAQAPKTEIRAAWVATVSQLDWPNSYSEVDQKESMLRLLDSVKAWNLNAIFLQIRPTSDAFYESSLTPWSKFVSGTRGTSPGYDPLQFTIDEAHKRGIELHGWLNPYRYESSFNDNEGRPNGVYEDHPEWLLYYADARILNPGIPEVMHHLKEVVGEIINNYDIDGIHFDDYFYPYEGTANEDIDTFNSYGGDFDEIGDWRRNNVSTMISMVSDTIMSVKPYVRFGISPFGIYGNGQNPAGISGLDAYNTIYTDPIEWMENGSIDYLCPQLYWAIGGGQDFGTLLPWWAEYASANGRHVIAGHGIYRYDSNPTGSIESEWGTTRLHELKEYFEKNKQRENARTEGWTLNEIVNQIEIVRDNRDKNALGSAFFRYEDFIRVSGLVDQLKSTVYPTRSIMPAMEWKNLEAINPPINIRWEVDSVGANYLTWDQTSSEDRYILYASSSDQEASTVIADPYYIHDIIYTDKYYFVGDNSIPKPYLYITTYDRYGQESATATRFNISPPSTAPTLQSPANGEIDLPSVFNLAWSKVDIAQSYLVEVSTDETFAFTTYDAVVEGNSKNTNEFKLEGETTYYWRVTPQNLAGKGTASTVFDFTTGFPRSPELIFPDNDQENVELSPLIKWADNPRLDSIHLRIAKGNNQFLDYNVVIDARLGAVNEFQVTELLEEYTTYHIRIVGSNPIGESLWTDVSFKTLKVVPAAPEFYSPMHDSIFFVDESIDVQWTKRSNATGYSLILSTDSERQQVVEDKAFFYYNDTTYTYDMLPVGTYFISVAGKNIGGIGEYSQVRIEVIPLLGGIDQPGLLRLVQEADGDIFLIFDRKVEELGIVDLIGRDREFHEVSEGQKPVFRIDNGALTGVGIIHFVFDGRRQAIKVIGRR